MRYGLLVATMALGALAACGGEGGEAGGEGGPPETVDRDSLVPAGGDTGAGGGTTARAELLDASGNPVGTATLTESGGAVQIAVQVTNVPAGAHGIHIHQTGTCTAPDFASAGGHFNPTQRQHGLQNPQGPHAGDMENLEVPAGGSGTAQLTSDRVTLGSGPNSLMDADGSALVIHATADDQVTDPSGNSGDRIACGVITTQ